MHASRQGRLSLAQDAVLGTLTIKIPGPGRDYGPTDQQEEVKLTAAAAIAQLSAVR
ncbi:MAG TPA: hypothetical protein VKB58_00760 [Terriglobales bacterium]|nr:hypothetical protein [Terriglobales bacterium]